MDKFVTQNGQWAPAPIGGGGPPPSNAFVSGGNPFLGPAFLGLTTNFTLQIGVNGVPFVELDAGTGAFNTLANIHGSNALFTGNATASTVVGGTVASTAGDVTSSANVLAPAGFVQVGPVPPVGPFGDVRVAEVFVGDAATRVGFLADLQQTSGSDTGFVTPAFFRYSTLGNSDTFGTIGLQSVLEHGGTGVVSGTLDAFSAFFGTNPDAAPATAIGSMGTVQGFDSEADMSAGASASAAATVCFRARQPFGTDATHTVNTAFGLLVDNQGATGITTGVGVDVRRCTGAGSFSIGVRNAGNTCFPAQSPAAFGAAINNLPNPDATWLRLQATAPIDFTGIASGTDGQTLVVGNVGAANAVTLRHLSASSSAGNRFSLKAGLPQVLGPGDTIALIYDFQTGVWRQWPTL